MNLEGGENKERVHQLVNSEGKMEEIINGG